jgi:hypothetical protein
MGSRRKKKTAKPLPTKRKEAEKVEPGEIFSSPSIAKFLKD